MFIYIFIYRVSHFNISTLLTRKRSIFPKKHKRGKLYNIEGGRSEFNLEFDLESIFQDHL